MVGLFNLGTNAAFAVLVVYAVGPESEMDLSEGAFGLLLTTIAGGMVCGSLLANRIERHVRRSVALIVAIAGGVLLVAMPAATASPVAIGAGFAVGGFFIALWNVITVSLRQRIAPPHLLGRLNSSYRLVAWGTRPLGAALGGVIAETVGVRAVFVVAGAVIAASLVGMLVVNDARMDAAEREADEAAVGV
jgi:MFS family permease